MSKLWEIPDHEKPRERAKKYGLSSLADYELLALLLGSGARARSVMVVAREVVSAFDGLERLREATLVELQKIDGIGEARAILIKAALELGRRASEAFHAGRKLKAPGEVYDFLRRRMTNLDHEELWALYLTVKGDLIEERVISKGALNRTAVDPATVFKWALKLSAAGVIIAHNHPSGDPTPSSADVELTHYIDAGGRLLNVRLLDHVIVGHESYYSFAENGDEEDKSKGKSS